MKLIAFTGPMGSGKSTAIEILKGFRPVRTGFANVKFAGPLYEMQEMIYRRISSVYTRPTTFVKDRKLLQWLGTEFGRSLSESLWVDLWASEVKKIESRWTDNGMDCYVTCDDVRFDNEAEAVRSMGGYVIKLTCDRNKDRITTANGIAGHASEAGISDNLIDFTISNNDTEEVFKLKLNKLFEQIAQNKRKEK